MVNGEIQRQTIAELQKMSHLVLRKTIGISSISTRYEQRTSPQKASVATEKLVWWVRNYRICSRNLSTFFLFWPL